MQNSALAGALVRFLNDERLDCCVLGVAAADRVNLVVPAGALAGCRQPCGHSAHATSWS